MELYHYHTEGRLLIELLDAHANGELTMELCHHHGGGRLLVDLKDARDIGKPKIELCHHHGSRRRTNLTQLSIFLHVCYRCILKSTSISSFA